MFNSNEVHFAGDYLQQEKAFSTATDAVYSDCFQLGTTHGGLRIRGWIEGEATASTGGAVTTTLYVGSVEDSTEATDWTALSAKTVSAGSATSVSGEIFNDIPETDKPFMRLGVASTALTGSYTVAIEYIPR